ncbi:MAG: PKD domain-containing protein [Thioalkalispiraceae bacterium]|jgi:hypothetical protein
MQYTNRQIAPTHRFATWVAAGFMATFILSGCGGGGSDGGGNGANSVEYTGNTSPASISEDNAQAISNQTFTGSDAANAANPTFVASPSKSRSSAYATSKLLGQLETITNTIKATKSAPNRSPSATTSVEYNDTCAVSGSVRFTGTIDDVTKQGSLTLAFMDCNDGDIIVNGSATLNANAYNADIDEYTDVELIYDNLHFVSVDPADKIDWQIGANLHAEKIYTGDLNPYTEIATINLTLSENIGGASYKYDNYVTEVEYDQYLVPSQALVNVSGRLYHYLYGYVDVETITSLHYPTVQPLTYPDSGGPLVYTGEANKKIKLTPVSATLVNVAADTDGDDFYEYSITVPWTALKNDHVNNNAPVADAGSDVTIALGETAQLDGSLSTDADYNLLTFTWTVTDQPAGSNAGLAGADSANATLTPDTAGTYTLELTVYDGWYSDTDTVTVTVTP